MLGEGGGADKVRGNSGIMDQRYYKLGTAWAMGIMDQGYHGPRVS